MAWAVGFLCRRRNERQDARSDPVKYAEPVAIAAVGTMVGIYIYATLANKGLLPW